LIIQDNFLFLNLHGDDEDEDDENIDCDDPNEPDGSLSGSDELEKESCDGSLGTVII
jgi:hypothetical protein